MGAAAGGRPSRRHAPALLALGLIVAGCLLLASAAPVSPPSRTLRPPLTMIGLGDSVPAADTCGCSGFLELTARQLAADTGRRVALHNDAVDGWTVPDVIDAVRNGTANRDLSAGADLIVIEVGANDLPLGRLGDPRCPAAKTAACFAGSLATIRDRLTRLVGQVRAADPTPRPVIAVLGYWNVSVDGAVGQARGDDYVLASDQLTRSFNAIVEEVSERTGATYVDAYTPLKDADGSRDPTDDLISDGDHPNASGHRRLAAAVVSTLRRTGAIASWSH